MTCPSNKTWVIATNSKNCGSIGGLKPYPMMFRTSKLLLSYVSTGLCLKTLQRLAGSWLFRVWGAGLEMGLNGFVRK